MRTTPRPTPSQNAALAALMALVLLGGCGTPRPVERPRPRARFSKHIGLSMQYTVRVPGDTEWVRFLLAVPQSVPGRQIVSQPRYTGVAPSRRFDRKGTRYAEWILREPDGDQRFGLAVDVEVLPADLAAIRAVGQPDAKRAPGRFLKSEPYLRAKDPRIKAALAQAGLGPKRGPVVEEARMLFTYVVNRLRNDGYLPDAQGAVKALRSRVGDCTDYTDLLVALARARRIPARHITGYVMTLDGSTPKHSWAELYSPKLGWFPVDPLWGDLKKATFERRPIQYIQMYDNRNDEVINFWRLWFRGDAVHVEERLKIGPRRHQDSTG